MKEQSKLWAQKKKQQIKCILENYEIKFDTEHNFNSCVDDIVFEIYIEKITSWTNGYNHDEDMI